MKNFIKRVWSFIFRRRVYIKESYSFNDTVVDKEGITNRELDNSGRFYMTKRDLGVFEVESKMFSNGIPLTTLTSMKSGKSFVLHDDTVNLLFIKCKSTVGAKLIEQLKSKG